MRVWNNTMIGNATHLSVHDTQGYNLAASEVAMGTTWTTDDVVAFNNIMSRGNGSTLPFLLVRDQAYSPFKPASTMLTASDKQRLLASQRRRPTVFAEWWESSTAPTRSTDLAGYRAVSGRDANSLMPAPSATEPFFANELAGDYRLRRSSPGHRQRRAAPR